MKAYHYVSAVAGFIGAALMHYTFDNDLATGWAFFYGMSQLVCGNYCGDLERKEARLVAKP